MRRSILIDNRPKDGLQKWEGSWGCLKAKSSRRR
nr:MAG TPA: hypothetical protein [Caudoviricetes sp.]